jgi:hypothetical protein
MRVNSIATATPRRLSKTNANISLRGAVVVLAFATSALSSRFSVLLDTECSMVDEITSRMAAYRSEFPAHSRVLFGRNGCRKSLCPS